ncbi:hypothetical protein AB0F91_03275 [Amycolatopsis sp. NPDC023774]|uniref:hypothetical protein n=1 Tax=Amycolatopsis sp. NPDC023774 TaxID=3155015 RepID=UPI0033D53BDE
MLPVVPEVQEVPGARIEEGENGARESGLSGFLPTFPGDFTDLTHPGFYRGEHIG